MRKTDVTQRTLYSWRALKERIPEAHPLRNLRVLVDDILRSMSARVGGKRVDALARDRQHQSSAIVF